MAKDRTDRIASIIGKRQPLAMRITEVEVNLQALASELSGLDQHRNQLLSQADDIETRGRLQELNLTTIQSDIQAELGALR